MRGDGSIANTISGPFVIKSKINIYKQLIEIEVYQHMGARIDKRPHRWDSFLAGALKIYNPCVSENPKVPSVIGYDVVRDPVLEEYDKAYLNSIAKSIRFQSVHTRKAMLDRYEYLRAILDDY
jgi:hypothetical protein